MDMKGLSATSQSGRYTFSYPRGQKIILSFRLFNGQCDGSEILEGPPENMIYYTFPFTLALRISAGDILL